MYKNKEIEEDEQQEKPIKELSFKREYDKIEDGVERNKRKIIDNINTYAINQSNKVQNEIEKKLQWYKTRQQELEDKGVDFSKVNTKNFIEFKSYQGGGEKADAIQTKSEYVPRKSVLTDPLRTTKIMSET